MGSQIVADGLLEFWVTRSLRKELQFSKWGIGRLNVLDHIVLAAPDLDEAKDAFDAQTGVMPIDGGPHEGLGTRNALVSFGDGTYLEIIAPDPEQPLQGTRGERLARMSHAVISFEGIHCHQFFVRADSLKV